MTPTCAAIIIGIENWERYTKPLVESIRKHEPGCRIVVVDNASETPYPQDAKTVNPGVGRQGAIHMLRTERLCYSAAINAGKSQLNEGYDYYIVLSNDVLCTGPFAHMLGQYENAVAGPQLWQEHGLSWIVGWCVVIPRKVWQAINGFDENFQYSSWEDVDASHSARKAGFELIGDPNLPFIHLDQKQRFGLPGYEGSESHNFAYFKRKHGEWR